MKRKLDENNKPITVSKTGSESDGLGPTSTREEPTTGSKFSDLGLDSRLLQAIATQKFHSPTLVQSKVIPLALNGQDVLAKAKTGSGKTAAYLLPLLHAILKRKQVRFVWFGAFFFAQRNARCRVAESQTTGIAVTDL